MANVFDIFNVKRPSEIDSGIKSQGESVSFKTSELNCQKRVLSQDSTEEDIFENKHGAKVPGNDTLEEEQKSIRMDNIPSFVIPKLKRKEEDLLTEIGSDTHEFQQEILPAIRKSYRCTSSLSRFSYYRIRTVHNSDLTQAYLEKRRELKQAGYSDRDVADSYAFLLVESEAEVETICKEGVKIGNLTASCLGDPDMGVQLSKHADVLRSTSIPVRSKGIIIMFKVMKGHVKPVFENRGMPYLEPTPNHECHVAKANPQDGNTVTLSQLFETSQLYLYEYGDLTVEQRPRHICPFAVMAFNYKEDVRKIKPVEVPIVSPKLSSPKIFSPKLTSPPAYTSPTSRPPSSSSPYRESSDEEYATWSGRLSVKGLFTCKVEMFSTAACIKPVKLGTTLNVTKKCSLPLAQSKYFGQLSSLRKNGEVYWRGNYINVCELRPNTDSRSQFQKVMNYLGKNNSMAVLKPDSDTVLLMMPDCALTYQLGLTKPHQYPIVLHCIFLSKQSCKFKSPRYTINQHRIQSPPPPTCNNNTCVARSSTLSPNFATPLQINVNNNQLHPPSPSLFTPPPSAPPLLPDLWSSTPSQLPSQAPSPSFFPPSLPFNLRIPPPPPPPPLPPLPPPPPPPHHSPQSYPSSPVKWPPLSPGQRHKSSSQPLLTSDMIPPSPTSPSVLVSAKSSLSPLSRSIVAARESGPATRLGPVAEAKLLYPHLSGPPSSTPFPQRSSSTTDMHDPPRPLRVASLPVGFDEGFAQKVPNHSMLNRSQVQNMFDSQNKVQHDMKNKRQKRSDCEQDSTITSTCAEDEAHLAFEARLESQLAESCKSDSMFEAKHRTSTSMHSHSDIELSESEVESIVKKFSLSDSSGKHRKKAKPDEERFDDSPSLRPLATDVVASAQDMRTFLENNLQRSRNPSKGDKDRADKVVIDSVQSVRAMSKATKVEEEPTVSSTDGLKDLKMANQLSTANDMKEFLNSTLLKPLKRPSPRKDVKKGINTKDKVARISEQSETDNKHLPTILDKPSSSGSDTGGSPDTPSSTSSHVPKNSLPCFTSPVMDTPTPSNTESQQTPTSKTTETPVVPSSPGFLTLSRRNNNLANQNLSAATLFSPPRHVRVTADVTEVKIVNTYEHASHIPKPGKLEAIQYMLHGLTQEVPTSRLSESIMVVLHQEEEEEDIRYVRSADSSEKLGEDSSSQDLLDSPPHKSHPEANIKDSRNVVVSDKVAEVQEEEWIITDVLEESQETDKSQKSVRQSRSRSRSRSPSGSRNSCGNLGIEPTKDNSEGFTRDNTEKVMNDFPESLEKTDEGKIEPNTTSKGSLQKKSRHHRSRCKSGDSSKGGNTESRKSKSNSKDMDKDSRETKSSYRRTSATTKGKGRETSHKNNSDERCRELGKEICRNGSNTSQRCKELGKETSHNYSGSSERYKDSRKETTHNCRGACERSNESGRSRHPSRSSGTSRSSSKFDSQTRDISLNKQLQQVSKIADKVSKKDDNDRHQLRNSSKQKMSSETRRSSGEKTEKSSLNQAGNSDKHSRNMHDKLTDKSLCRISDIADRLSSVSKPSSGYSTRFGDGKPKSKAQIIFEKKYAEKLKQSCLPQIPGLYSREMVELSKVQPLKLNTNVDISPSFKLLDSSCHSSSTLPNPAVKNLQNSLKDKTHSPQDLLDKEKEISGKSGYEQKLTQKPDAKTNQESEILSTHCSDEDSQPNSRNLCSVVTAVSNSDGLNGNRFNNDMRGDGLKATQSICDRRLSGDPRSGIQARVNHPRTNSSNSNKEKTDDKSGNSSVVSGDRNSPNTMDAPPGRHPVRNLSMAQITEDRHSRQFHPYKMTGKRKPMASFNIQVNNIDELLSDLTSSGLKWKRLRESWSFAMHHNIRQQPRFSNYTFFRNPVPPSPDKQDSFRANRPDEEMTFKTDNMPEFEMRAQQADMLDEFFMGGGDGEDSQQQISATFDMEKLSYDSQEAGISHDVGHDTETSPHLPPGQAAHNTIVDVSREGLLPVNETLDSISASEMGLQHAREYSSEELQQMPSEGLHEKDDRMLRVQIPGCHSWAEAPHQTWNKLPKSVESAADKFFDQFEWSFETDSIKSKQDIDVQQINFTDDHTMSRGNNVVRSMDTDSDVTAANSAKRPRDPRLAKRNVTVPSVTQTVECSHHVSAPVTSKAHFSTTVHRDLHPLGTVETPVPVTCTDSNQAMLPDSEVNARSSEMKSSSQGLDDLQEAPMDFSDSEQEAQDHVDRPSQISTTVNGPPRGNNSCPRKQVFGRTLSFPDTLSSRKRSFALFQDMWTSQTGLDLAVPAVSKTVPIGDSTACSMTSRTDSESLSLKENGKSAGAVKKTQTEDVARRRNEAAEMLEELNSYLETQKPKAKHDIEHISKAVDDFEQSVHRSHSIVLDQKLTSFLGHVEPVDVQDSSCESLPQPCSPDFDILAPFPRNKTQEECLSPRLKTFAKQLNGENDTPSSSLINSGNEDGNGNRKKTASSKKTKHKEQRCGRAKKKKPRRSTGPHPDRFNRWDHVLFPFTFDPWRDFKYERNPQLGNYHLLELQDNPSLDPRRNKAILQKRDLEQSQELTDSHLHNVKPDRKTTVNSMLERDLFAPTLAEQITCAAQVRRIQLGLTSSLMSAQKHTSLEQASPHDEQKVHLGADFGTEHSCCVLKSGKSNTSESGMSDHGQNLPQLKVVPKMGVGAVDSYGGEIGEKFEQYTTHHSVEVESLHLRRDIISASAKTQQENKEKKHSTITDRKIFASEKRKVESYRISQPSKHHSSGGTTKTQGRTSGSTMKQSSAQSIQPSSSQIPVPPSTFQEDCNTSAQDLPCDSYIGDAQHAAEAVERLMNGAVQGLQTTGDGILRSLTVFDHETQTRDREPPANKRRRFESPTENPDPSHGGLGPIDSTTCEADGSLASLRNWTYYHQGKGVDAKNEQKINSAVNSGASVKDRESAWLQNHENPCLKTRTVPSLSTSDAGRQFLVISTATTDKSQSISSMVTDIHSDREQRTQEVKNVIPHQTSYSKHSLSPSKCDLFELNKYYKDVEPIVDSVESQILEVEGCTNSERETDGYSKSLVDDSESQKGPKDLNTNDMLKKGEKIPTIGGECVKDCRLSPVQQIKSITPAVSYQLPQLMPTLKPSAELSTSDQTQTMNKPGLAGERPDIQPTLQPGTEFHLPEQRNRVYFNPRMMHLWPQMQQLNQHTYPQPYVLYPQSVSPLNYAPSSLPYPVSHLTGTSGLPWNAQASLSVNFHPYQNSLPSYPPVITYPTYPTQFMSTQGAVTSETYTPPLRVSPVFMDSLAMQQQQQKVGELLKQTVSQTISGNNDSVVDPGVHRDDGSPPHLIDIPCVTPVTNGDHQSKPSQESDTEPVIPLKEISQFDQSLEDISDNDDLGLGSVEKDTEVPEFRERIQEHIKSCLDDLEEFTHDLHEGRPDADLEPGLDLSSTYYTYCDEVLTPERLQCSLSRGERTVLRQFADVQKQVYESLPDNPWAVRGGVTEGGIVNADDDFLLQGKPGDLDHILSGMYALCRSGKKWLMLVHSSVIMQLAKTRDADSEHCWVQKTLALISTFRKRGIVRLISQCDCDRYMRSAYSLGLCVAKFRQKEFPLLRLSLVVSEKPDKTLQVTDGTRQVVYIQPKAFIQQYLTS
ncbi:uncharacterized protein [Haliotis asinina]|uniref:uncharacterized protein isoform X2 n=1 Tax=Haliotis asinina TaxID=109174 RepID=UPI003531A1BE